MFSVAGFVVAAVIVALFGGFLLSGVLTQPPSDESLPPAGASASPSPGTSYSVTRVPGSWNGTFRSVATDDALWVPTDDGVARLDGVNSEVTTIPTSAEAPSLVRTDDAIWAMGTNGVERIDRRTLTVSDGFARPSGEPFVGFGYCHRPIVADGSLWFAESGSPPHSLLEIDLASGALRDEYVVADDWTTEGCDPWMGATHDAIWVHSDAADGTGRLTRFDLGSREFTDVFDDVGGRLSGGADCCIVGDDAIWLMGERSASRFDLATYEVTDTLDVGRELRGGVATPGSLWVVDQHGRTDDSNNGVVYRIDTATREVTDTLDVGQNPQQPALLYGAVWVANHSGRWSVMRIDVESRQVTDTVRIPVEHPHTPLASDGVIWVYTQEGALLRIDSDTDRSSDEVTTE
jgi:hypothetical protein